MPLLQLSVAITKQLKIKLNQQQPLKSEQKKEYLSQPLVSHIYTADPSAHVFNGRIYIYPSHDTATGTKEDDLGSHFDMRDYHILSMDSVGGPVTDHGVALDIKNVPWAGRQMWAPDAAFANGKYYLYFPVKNKQDVFQIGVAVSDKPEGPFTAEKEPIKNSYSIDPCVFKDDDGKFYMYFGGIWGGQLQRWNNNKYDSSAKNRTKEEMAVLPRIARLNADMKSFAEPVKEIKLVDKTESCLVKKIMIKDSLKRHGCLNIKANTISPIQPAIHIYFVMQLVIILMVRLLIRVFCLNLLKDGQIIIQLLK